MFTRLPMKRIARYRPSGAMVVAIVALVLAAAGSATAAGLITSGEIKNNTVRSSDIRNNTVRSKDVRNHTLLRRDFKPGVLVPGPRGLTGPRGATGPAGHNGTNGFGTLAYPFGSDVLADGAEEDLGAFCPAGTFPTGGAAAAFDDTSGDDVGDAVIQSQFLSFDGGPDGYAAHFNNNTGADVDIQVEGICANANNLDIAAKEHRRKARR